MEIIPVNIAATRELPVPLFGSPGGMLGAQDGTAHVLGPNPALGHALFGVAAEEQLPETGRVLSNRRGFGFLHALFAGQSPAMSTADLIPNQGLTGVQWQKSGRGGTTNAFRGQKSAPEGQSAAVVLQTHFPNAWNAQRVA